MKVKLFDRYGGVKPGTYECVEENYDHLTIKWRGKTICIPANLFEKDDRVYEEVFMQPSSL